MLHLPPPYSLISLRDAGDAFAHAQAVAAAEGAGALVWSPRDHAIDLAVVLEPAEILAISRQVVCAGLNAAADALAVDCPPERPITCRWPDGLCFDGLEVGLVRLAWAEAAESSVPAWLVLGLSLRVGALAEAGYVDFRPGPYVEHFARHLMLALDEWQAEGPEAVVARCRRLVAAA